MQVRHIGLAACFAALVGIGGLWLLNRGHVDETTRAPGQSASSRAWNLITAGSPSTAAAPTAFVRTPDQLRKMLLVNGPLQGTEPAGEWCITPAPSLKPCRGLRSRFEYYFLGLGQVTAPEIRSLVQDEAQRAHGALLAGQIMSVFDQYWSLRNHEWTNHFSQNDRSTWTPLFEEQKAVRRQILGVAWANAFFAEDEQHFVDHLAQLESGRPAPPDPGEPVPQMSPGKDPGAIRAERVARYGEEAADRLAEVDAEWEAWDRRVNAARAEWTRLQASANLSTQQQQEAMNRYLTEQFQGKDLLRARGLIKF